MPSTDRLRGRDCWRSFALGLREPPPPAAADLFEGLPTILILGALKEDLFVVSFFFHNVTVLAAFGFPLEFERGRVSGADDGEDAGGSGFCRGIATGSLAGGADTANVGVGALGLDISGGFEYGFGLGSAFTGRSGGLAGG